MIERRRFRRYRIQNVRGKIDLGNDVRIKDISVSGLAFDSLEPVDVGQKYHLTIFQNDQSFAFTGTIIWCRPVAHSETDVEASPAIFRAGMKFENLLSNQWEGVVQLVQEARIGPLRSREPENERAAQDSR